MSDRTITAWTASGMSYPPYFNITSTPSGGAMITLRSPAPNREVIPGVTAGIILTPEEWQRIRAEIKRNG